MQRATQSDKIARYRKLVAVAKMIRRATRFGTKYCCGFWPKKNRPTANIDSQFLPTHARGLALIASATRADHLVSRHRSAC
jgi:hypothetical protein